jgi:TatD DNase family protein
MPLIDTHAHLDDEQLAADLDGVMARARAAGVEAIVAIATTAESSRATLAIARRFPGVVLPTVGIQPNYCAQAGPGDWDEVAALARGGEAVALGETGLDRYWDYAPFSVQEDYFDRHLRLSQETGLPFVVHMRDCGDDILRMLREARTRGPLAGVMHSYTGDAATAAACLELGLHLSFAGMVTYKKSRELRAVAASVPADRLLVETDSPYLSPEPVRGSRPNEPAHVVHTAACLAGERGAALEELAAQTTANARRLFRI